MIATLRGVLFAKANNGAKRLCVEACRFRLSIKLADVARQSGLLLLQTLYALDERPQLILCSLRDAIPRVFRSHALVHDALHEAESKPGLRLTRSLARFNVAPSVIQGIHLKHRAFYRTQALVCTHGG